MHDGAVSLISSGKDGTDSVFVDSSADGRDVFFGTHGRLALTDTDFLGDLYDAREEGGLSNTAASECSGESCQGSPGEAARETSPGSASFVGTGNIHQLHRCRRGPTVSAATARSAAFASTATTTEPAPTGEDEVRTARADVRKPNRASKENRQMTEATTFGSSLSTPRWSRAAILAATLLAFAAALAVSVAPAGAAVIEPGQFEVTTTTNQAGAHPDVTANVEIKSDENGVVGEYAKDIVVDLPAGFTGYPAGIPRCSIQLFTASLMGGVPCPANTQIGMEQLTLSVGFGKITFLSRLQPGARRRPAGQVRLLGARLLRDPGSHRCASWRLRVAHDIRNISTLVYLDASKLTLWGVPAASSHDGERGECMTLFGPSGEQCPAGVESRPFISNPTTCTGGPQTATLHIDSYETRGAWKADGSRISAIRAGRKTRRKYPRSKAATNRRSNRR